MRGVTCSRATELNFKFTFDWFQYNKFKQRLIRERVTTPTTTVYRCGSLIDLCRGPHVRHTGKVKAFKVTKVSRSSHKSAAALRCYVQYTKRKLTVYVFMCMYARQAEIRIK